FHGERFLLLHRRAGKQHKNIRRISLRDHFRKDLSDIDNRPSGSGAKKVKTRTYFEALQFLKTVMKRKRTSGIVADRKDNTRGSNRDKLGEEDREAGLNTTSSRSSPLLSTSSTDDGSKQAGKPLVPQFRKQKKKTTDIDLVSSVIMKMLGELREQLRESRRKEEREDNIASFLCSLEYDIRQIPPHRLSALKQEIMQVVHRYVHV
ncbi:unnamed protein product, partial [Staurois parvus]